MRVKNEFFATYFLNQVRVIETDLEEMKGYLDAIPYGTRVGVQMKLDRLLSEYTAVMVEGSTSDKHLVNSKWNEYLKTLPPESNNPVVTQRSDKQRYRATYRNV